MANTNGISADSNQSSENSQIFPGEDPDSWFEEYTDSDYLTQPVASDDPDELDLDKILAETEKAARMEPFSDMHPDLLLEEPDDAL